MIKPINEHIVIEPVVHDSFVSSMQQTYDEIGVIIALQEGVSYSDKVKVGDKVYFDSWLASKFPKNETEFYWLVNYNDIKAYEPISEE